MSDQETPQEAVQPESQFPAPESMSGLPGNHPGLPNAVLPPGLGVAINDAAGQQVLRKILNQQQQPAATKFYLLVCAEDAAPVLQQAETVEALIDAINAVLGTPAYVFCFMGHHLPISQGPHRYLVTPMGPIPMFVPPSISGLQIESSGYVGPTDTTNALSSALAAFEAQQVRVVNNNEAPAAEDPPEEELDVI